MNKGHTPGGGSSYPDRQLGEGQEKGVGQRDREGGLCSGARRSLGNWWQGGHMLGSQATTLTEPFEIVQGRPWV